MTTVPGIVLRRLSDEAFYAGTADREPVYTGRHRGAAVFTRRDDAVRRARGLAGPEWGKTLTLAPAPW